MTFPLFSHRDYIKNDANWIVNKKEDINNNEALHKQKSYPQ